MDKDRKLPGQPLLSQIVNVIQVSIIKSENKNAIKMQIYCGIDRLIIDGCDKEKISYQEIVCQYDHNDTNS